MTKSTLTARTALHIAASYGFRVSDGKWEARLIRGSIIQAREAALTQRLDGRRKTAEQYFEGYMACTASEIYGEAMKARDFERNAY